MRDGRSIVRTLRHRSALSLRDLADRAGTSSATISNYETGRKEPRLTTLAHLAEAAGYELVVDIRPRLTEQERLSLALGRAVADKLRSDPDRVLAVANQNLERQRAADVAGHASQHHDAWEMLLHGPVDALIAMLVTDAPIGRELRPTAPFAGVLDDSERAAALAGTDQGAQP